MPLPFLVTAAASLAAKFVPSLIGHFAGDKAEEAANSVAEIVQDVTGQDISTSEGLDAAEAVLDESPELLVQLRTRMAELNVELEKAYLEDRQSARSRDVELRKIGDKNWRANIMVLAAFVAVITIAFVLSYFTGLKGEVVGFLTAVGGMFARNIGTAFDFEFGSSRGSKEKDLIKGLKNDA